MRYDWRESVGAEPGTKPFFDEIDRRFYDSVRHFMPWHFRPFDNLIDFTSLRNKDVLEVGVGQGSHARLIAPHCKSYTGIDLTEAASEMTRQRLEIDDIDGTVLQMDAENMSFEDGVFDYIWSWGVIHHSSNTLNIVREMNRVLRPGGTATIMVYYRSWYYYVDGTIRGIALGQFKEHGSIHKVKQASTDGAIARFYSERDLRALVDGVFEVTDVTVTGLKTDVLPLPAGKVKDRIVEALPDAVTRFMTDRLRMGTLVIADLKKPGES